MDENTNPTETDFQDAFSTEMGVTPEPVVEPVVEPTVEPAVEPVADETPVVEPAKEEEPAKVETPEETADRESKEAADKTSEEAPQFATKDDVKDAMREYNQETTGRVDRVKSAQDEITQKLYPEGVDSKIYDTNGNHIQTAQDIVDRQLTNERTGEAYSYDEAASFMLEAQQKMSKNIEELTNWTEGIAEKNINLLEGNQRVMSKWADTFKTLPQETVQTLADTYISKQLKFDETNSYITEMNMTPEEFYDAVMSPYTSLSSSIAAEAKAAEATKSQQDQTDQSERNGIPPQRGQSNVKANTGDPMLDALVDELSKD